MRSSACACELARSRAASRGWAPPQAWDDAQIDEPDGRPSRDWKPRKRTTRRAVDIVEDAQFVRDYGGYREANFTQIAMRLGSAETSSTRHTAAPAVTPAVAAPRTPRPKLSHAESACWRIGLRSCTKRTWSARTASRSGRGEARAKSGAVAGRILLVSVVPRRFSAAFAGSQVGLPGRLVRKAL